MPELEKTDIADNNFPLVPEQLQLIYSNSVSVQLTLTDIHITLRVNNRPALIIAMPLPTAKTLGKAIAEATRQYEHQSGIQIHDMNELNSKMAKNK